MPAATLRRISMEALARYQVILLGEQRHIRCEQLARVVARIVPRSESNPRPLDYKSSALTTTPSSHLELSLDFGNLQLTNEAGEEERDDNNGGLVMRNLMMIMMINRSNGHAYATMLRPSVRLSVSTLVCDVCIVVKRCVFEQKLLLTAYRKSHMKNRLELK